MTHQHNVAVFDSTVQKTHDWLHDLQAAWAWAENDQEAYIALRTGLHFLRDRLTVDEVSDLSAQLPMLVRGFFYEGWHPADKPLDANTEEDVAAYINDAMSEMRPADPFDLLEAVFTVLTKNLTEGEMAHIRTMLPKDLQKYIPDVVSE